MILLRSDLLLIVDFHTLEAMYLLTTTEEAALLMFCELRISLQDQFCLEKEVNLWRKKESKNFRKLYVPASQHGKEHCTADKHTQMKEKRCNLLFRA